MNDKLYKLEDFKGKLPRLPLSGESLTIDQWYNMCALIVSEIANAKLKPILKRLNELEYREQKVKELRLSLTKNPPADFENVFWEIFEDILA